MSTGADCRFIQAADGTWTYELQNWPYGESYSYNTYGPFDLYAKAVQHLSDNHANPGGWSTKEHPAFDCPHNDLAPLDPFFDKRLLSDGYVGECRKCGRLVKADD